MNIDWPLLTRQKQTLMVLAADPRIDPLQREHLDGILNLLDSLQDAAEPAAPANS